MAIHDYLETVPLNPLVTYDDIMSARLDGVSYTGTARKHPYDGNKFLLAVFESEKQSILYEFKISDILHAEELPDIGSEEGESLLQMRVWIKKGAFGIRLNPFVVGSNEEIGIDTTALYQ